MRHDRGRHRRILRRAEKGGHADAIRLVIASDGAGRGHYVFASGRFVRWIARVGVARTSAFGHTDTALRLAIALRYARYTVGLSREESAGGFDPTYQFVLSGIFR